MKKAKRTLNNFLGLLFILFVAILFIAIFEVNSNLSQPVNNRDEFENVTRYEDVLREELRKYELESYTPILLALMQQESKGRGGDPMQSSESAGLPRNTIEDPVKSIQQGVKHFHASLTYGKEKNVDDATIIQSYNMGLGYIDFIEKNGKKHTEELAKEFSSIQVDKQPDIYNCGGDKSNFRYPYCYGDFTYYTKVTKNIEQLTEQPATAKEDTNDSSS
ncbi:lysozyme family protein [Metabacillus arenae]|uniref:Lysozyme family protein n=1 Tax=Metabacillus arenae TaxID=2771434 RepID=A0A926NGV7_9BACI|nr:lysozyme family protein [Metabacillus arenae]MBD1380308.1 lysozyme family protein [Metabacillus arenae]